MRSAPEPLPRRVRRALARVDVRLTILLAGVTAAFTSLLLCGLLVYAVTESLEEQAAAADAVLARIADAVARGAAVDALPAGVAYRLRDAAGRVRADGGAWPAASAVWHDATTWTAVRAGAADALLRERRQGAGDVVAVIWPLRHFVRERGELVTRAALVIVVGIFGAVGLGMLSARRALAPLRDTTAAIRAIGPRDLATRIPVRGTSDDVDALAHATNEVLGRLEWAFARLAGFSADVSHELRTPVNRVLNTAEVALTTTDDAAAKDDALAGIHATAEAMRDTIERLLLLARGEDGRLPLVKRDVDLGAVVGGLVELYAPEAERLAKTLVGTPSRVALSADRELVERAIANLLDNALAHTEPGTTIAVAMEARDGEAAVVVEDSGAGIRAGDAERIFDRFVRLDDARSPGGAGLGLPIARMVARLHGGDLVVTASALGGAAFRLTLPR